MSNSNSLTDLVGSLSAVSGSISLGNKLSTSNREAEKTCIAKLSPNDLYAHANWKPRSVWEGGFDVAVWLNTPKGCMRPLQLSLRYADQSGDIFVPVDIFNPSLATTALLTGSMALTIKGKIGTIGLYLEGEIDGISISVDEWYVVPHIKMPSSGLSSNN